MEIKTNNFEREIINALKKGYKMLREQKEQSSRLLRLECRPASEARSMRREVIKAVISAMVGALITVLVRGI